MNGLPDRPAFRQPMDRVAHAGDPDPPEARAAWPNCARPTGIRFMRSSAARETIPTRPST